MSIIKILMICHGNICRSTMAEFVMKELVRQHHLGDAYEIASAATSREEIGNDTHWGTKEQLELHHIPYTSRKARQMTREDYGYYDLLIGLTMKTCGKSTGSPGETRTGRSICCWISRITPGKSPTPGIRGILSAPIGM